MYQEEIDIFKSRAATELIDLGLSIADDVVNNKFDYNKLKNGEDLLSIINYINSPYPTLKSKYELTLYATGKYNLMRNNEDELLTLHIRLGTGTSGISVNNSPIVHNLTLQKQGGNASLNEYYHLEKVDYDKVKSIQNTDEAITSILSGGTYVQDDTDPFKFNLEITVWKIANVEFTLTPETEFNILATSDDALFRYDRPILKDDGTLEIITGDEGVNPVIPDYDRLTSISLDLLLVSSTGATISPNNVFYIIASDTREKLTGIYIRDTLNELLDRPIPTATYIADLFEDSPRISITTEFDEDIQEDVIIPNFDETGLEYTLTEGANITIDRTDPLNPVISGTSAGASIASLLQTRTGTDNTVAISPLRLRTELNTKAPLFKFNVKDYGAVGDGIYLTDGAISSGSTTLTSASGLFVIADTGKKIKVSGAGAGGIDLLATMTYVSATTVTLSVASSSTVSSKFVVYGTDDTVAIQNALNAASAVFGAVVYAPRGIYVLAGALVTSVGLSTPNSQLYITPIDVGVTAHTIELLGEVEPVLILPYITAGPIISTGTIFHSMLVTGSGSYPSIISGGNDNNIIYGTEATLVNLKVKNIHFRCAANAGTNGPVIGAINAARITMFSVKGVEVNVDVTNSLLPQPTAEIAGIIWPQNNADGHYVSEDVQVGGFKYGFVFGEHATVDNMLAFGNRFGFVFAMSGHPIYAKRLLAHYNTYAVAVAGTGVVSAYAGSCRFEIQQLAIEGKSVTGNWRETIAHLYDPSNNGLGEIKFTATIGGVAGQTTFIKSNGVGINVQRLGDYEVSTSHSTLSTPVRLTYQEYSSGSTETGRIGLNVYYKAGSGILRDNTSYGGANFVWEAETIDIGTGGYFQLMTIAGVQKNAFNYKFSTLGSGSVKNQFYSNLLLSDVTGNNFSDNVSQDLPKWGKLSVVSEDNILRRGLSLYHHNTTNAGSLLNYVRSRGTSAVPVSLSQGDIIRYTGFSGHLNGAYSDDRSWESSYVGSGFGIGWTLITGKTDNNWTPVLRVDENKKVSIGNYGDLIPSFTLTDPPATFNVRGSISIDSSANKTANYTIALTDFILKGDAATGVFDFTLPDVTTCKGFLVILKKVDSSGNAITVVTTSSQVIDNSSTYSLATQNSTVGLYSDALKWWIVFKF